MGRSDRAVYILGNDPYYGWIRAFLESFREHNPEIRLMFIPYDDRTRRVERLAGRYRFEMVRDEAGLRELDAIGAEFIGRGGARHAIRRLWAFTGPVERFLYIDVDMISTANYDRAFDGFERSDADLVYFDADVEQVYLPGEFRDSMVRERGSPGFNTGNYFSRTGVFSREDWGRLAESARRDKAHFKPNKLEQPLLNYFCDMKGIRMAHLRTIAPDASSTNWAAREVIHDPSDGSYRTAEVLPNGERGRLYSVHYAGVNRVGYRMPNKELFLKYRLRGLEGPGSWGTRLGLAWKTSKARFQLRLLRTYYWPRLLERTLGRPRPGTSSE